MKIYISKTWLRQLHLCELLSETLDNKKILCAPLTDDVTDHNCTWISKILIEERNTLKI